MSKGIKKLLKKILKCQKKLLKIKEYEMLFYKDATAKTSNAIAYVDGSFNNNRNVGAYGIVFITKDSVKQYSGVPSFLPNEKVSSTYTELAAALQAIHIARSSKIKKLVIKYDCEIIHQWSKSKVDINDKTGQWYQKKVLSARKNLKIKFKKVKAHSKNRYNDLADSLAKAAVQKELSQLNSQNKKKKKPVKKKTSQQTQNIQTQAKVSMPKASISANTQQAMSKALTIHVERLPMII